MKNVAISSVDTPEVRWKDHQLRIHYGNHRDFQTVYSPFVRQYLTGWEHLLGQQAKSLLHTASAITS